MSGNGSVETSATLAAIGFSVAPTGYFGFWIDEADPRWPAVDDWRRRDGQVVPPIARTIFTKGELNGATWLRLEPEWHWGFPQPEDGFGYRDVTYDRSNFCGTCGIGLKQVAPFRMKSEPKWGKRNILQLNWVFDEYFVTPELWRTVFKPLGVQAGEVLSKKGQTLETVVQLVVDQEVDVDTKALTTDGPPTCDTCGRTKYNWVSRGFDVSPLGAPTAAIVRSKQWFGSGAAAYNSILITQQLRAAMIASGSRGADFRPCAPTASA